MDWAKQTHIIQIELTTHCNANCTGCNRTDPDTGVKRSEIPLEHLPVDTWKLIVDRDIVHNNIQQVRLNGNFGDAIMHKHLKEMIEYLVSAKPDIEIVIATNGGVRTTTWWSEFGKLLQHYKHNVVFAIDGFTKEEHETYRVDVNIDRVFENIKTFTSSGGNAQMMFTVFNYNKHLVDKLELKAKELGCSSYAVRPTLTAASDTDPAKRLDGDFKRKLYIVDRDKYIRYNKNLADSVHYKNNPSKCPWYNEGQIQVDHTGKVWPCCDVGTIYSNMIQLENIDTDEYSQLPTSELANLVDLNKNSLYNILSSEWYTRTLEQKLNDKPYYNCYEYCGVRKNYESK